MTMKENHQSLIIILVFTTVLIQFSIAKGGFTSQFGTKTTYFNRPAIEDSLPWKQESIPPDLEILKLDATLRHGTRYPSRKRAHKLEKIVPKFLKQFLETTNVSTFDQSLQDWVSKFPEDKFNLLSSLGWEEHVYLGKKYFSMAPKLWLRSKSNRKITVLSSSKVRSLASARAFLMAIKFMAETGTVELSHPDVQFHPEKVTNESNIVDEANRIYYDSFPVQVDDTLLRFFDNCKKYSETVTKNQTSRHEYKKYFHSDAMNKFSRDFNPAIENPKDIFSLYLLCAFEVANFNQSVWCQLFQKDHFHYLEYAADLKHFYKTGYGYGINHEQSCILLQAIMDQLGNESNAITLRFGHAETLIPLVSLLGFFNETGQLRANNFHENTDRTFRTAKIGPFSGNLAIILYSSRRDPSKKFISFVLNEYILKPFGLDCYFCEYHLHSAVHLEMQKRVEDCDTKCIFQNPEIKMEQSLQQTKNEL